jgi:hypothetical protein
MNILENGNHFVSLNDASLMTKNYRQMLPPTGGVLAHAIGKNAVLSILAQDTCVGLRVYYAINENGEKQLVFVGVNTFGDDLFEGLIADRTLLCPNLCSVENPLNVILP